MRTLLFGEVYVHHGQMYLVIAPDRSPGSGAVGPVLPGRRPARNAAITVGTVHHRLTTLRAAPTAVAAAGAVPDRAGLSVRLPLVALSTRTTVRSAEHSRHCRKSNQPARSAARAAWRSSGAAAAELETLKATVPAR